MIWGTIQITRMRCSCNKCDCGDITWMLKYDEETYMFSFLMGLNDVYMVICLHILMLDPLLFLKSMLGQV